MSSKASKTKTVTKKTVDKIKTAKSTKATKTDKTVPVAVSTKPKFDCSKCPGTCCSFPQIDVTMSEIKRLAKVKGTPLYLFRSQFFERTDDDSGWQIKHRKHSSLGGICSFYVDGKGCSVYKDRPETCRGFANNGKCIIYDFLAAMRRHTGDRTYFPSKLHI